MLTTKERLALRTTQTGNRPDTARRLVYSSAADTYGNPAATFTPGTVFACRFDGNLGKEALDEGRVPMVDAEIRVATGFEYDERDRIRLVSRWGEALSETEDYEIAGPARLTASALVIPLKKVS